MTLVLATRDGAPVSPVYAGPRYVSRGGTIWDGCDLNARPTLQWAKQRFAELTALMIEADAKGEKPLAAIYAREAGGLYDAIRDTERWLMAGGRRIA